MVVKRICILAMVLCLLCAGTVTDQAKAWSDSDDLAWEATNRWKEEHGYDFPIYGSTLVDLSPISDYLTLLSENGIYISLPDLSIMDYKDYTWIYTDIGKRMYFRYIVYNDGSKYTLTLQTPWTYRPREKAHVLLIASVLSIDVEEAAKLYSRLQYNVIDEWCVLDTEDYLLAYCEPRLKDGTLLDYTWLDVTKKLR